MILKKIKKSAFSLIELSIILLIIGAIVAAIIGAQKLIYLASLTSARTLTNSSPVNGIEDLVIWLETTSKDSLAANERIDGTLIDTWNDINNQSIPRVNAIQNLILHKPFYKEDAINGLPAIDFNAADTNYLLTTTLNGRILSQPNTIIVVWELTAFPTDYDAKIIDGIDAYNRHVIEIDKSSHIWQMWAGSSLYAEGSTIELNTPYITSSIFNSSSSEGYINGTLDIEGSVSTNSLGGITIAARYDQATGGANIKIGEIIIYDRVLSSFEREEIEEYLSTKWKINLVTN